jgi:hypothetical protein
MPRQYRWGKERYKRMKAMIKYHALCGGSPLVPCAIEAAFCFEIFFVRPQRQSEK